MGGRLQAGVVDGRLVGKCFKGCIEGGYGKTYQRERKGILGSGKGILGGKGSLGKLDSGEVSFMGRK